MIASGRNPKPRQFDLLIAAVAVDLGVPLLTPNAKDFCGIHESVHIISAE